MRKSKESWFKETEIAYQQLLELVSLQLNNIHSVDFSLRFWDIFIGAWLREFTDLVMLQMFNFEQGMVKMSSWLELPTINSLVEYRKLSKNPQFVENLRFDIWNVKSIEEAEMAIFRSTPKLTGTSQSKEKLGRNYLSATYLNRISEVALQIWFSRMPEKLKTTNPPQNARNESLRKKLNELDCGHNVYSKTVVSLLPKYLPSAYLESFNNLYTTTKPWKGKRYPRVIFTSNRHLYDDVFNFWVARATEFGSRLVLGQHGGFYGISEFPSFAERHEKQIADRYLTWGWSNRGKSIAGLATILVGAKTISRKNPKHLLIVTDQLFTMPRSLFSDIGESSRYLENIKSLISELGSAKPSVLVRIPLTHAESGRSQVEWFNEHVPRTAIDTGIRDFRHLLNESKLVVIPHNGTTLLESIALGVPTIIFWDKSIVWMRSEAQAVFDALEAAGVFHRTPESAASFINSIWNDVDGWWNSPATIEARNQFTDQYARTVPNPVRFLAKALQF